MRVAAPLLILAATGLIGGGRHEVGANSGNDGGLFVLDTRTGAARYFNAEAKEEEAGTYRLAVNSGALGGAWILNSKNGIAKYFNIRQGQVGPNMKFEEPEKPGPLGSFTLAANSGDAGGVYLMDSRLGLVRMFAFEGDRLGKDIRFDAGVTAAQETGRFSLESNNGNAGGVFLLDTKTGLCRFFQKDGAQFGKDMRFDAGAPADAKAGRFTLSANSGEAAGVFLADTKTGVCRYFRVDGTQFGRDIKFAAENPERSVEGRFAISANSGTAAGTFVLDSMTGLARFYHVIKGEQFGADFKFPDSPVFHKEAGRFALSANAGDWGGIMLQDTESGVVRYFKVDGKQVGSDIKD